MDMPPIVERMYEVNKWLLQKVGKFPRDQRLLLGQRLMQKSLDIQEALVAAALKGKGEEKSRILADISLALEQVRYLLRLARDSRCLNQDSWFFCVKNLMEIGKMLGGWMKSV
ncbi:MAG: four helix bundle protein [Elusimicrobia bacterium]|nr:four helix bundle protein [Elusimicrobiota bacterium]